MLEQKSFTDVLRECKRWADIGSGVSIVLVIALSSFAWYLGGIDGASNETKLGMMIIVAAVVIVVSIWQAAAFVAATLQTSELHKAPLIVDRMEGGGPR